MTEISAATTAARSRPVPDSEPPPSSRSAAFGASLARALREVAAGQEAPGGASKPPAPQPVPEARDGQALIDRLAGARLRQTDGVTEAAKHQPSLGSARPVLEAVGIAVADLHDPMSAADVEGLLTDSTNPIQRAVIMAVAEVIAREVREGTSVGGGRVERNGFRVVDSPTDVAVMAAAEPSISLEPESAVQSLPGDDAAKSVFNGAAPEPFRPKPPEAAVNDPYTVNSRPDGTVEAPPLPLSGSDLRPDAMSRYIPPAEIAREVLQNAGIFIGEMRLDPASPLYTFDALLAQYSEPDKRMAIMVAEKIAAQEDAGYSVSR